MNIIGIAEGGGDFKTRLDEAVVFAGRLAASRPDLLEFLKDELLNAGMSGRHAPDSARLL